ncbi:putative F420-dependent GLUCOSE-6-PHOSPHATE DEHYDROGENASE FGD2 domain protein [Mycobacterium xenopi 4042]|uniref:Putative F420-dependent GLUCOSE-6-PHOSPHATE DEHYDROGENASE FGD2 domain protein n=1 Tax=Mycobacterium xenopi 4042 TaxID=1299334 RepID=X7ZX81_MYCXE|nr:putative F420-dependent GLUCOSE-6-PHOSPHATE DEHYDROGENASE FGD2 domain protein [Mycobacterium xenopi 4042]
MIKGWTTGTDPATHIKAVQAVLDAGATPFMHFPSVIRPQRSSSTGPKCCQSCAER